MPSQNWLVTNEGNCTPFAVSTEENWPTKPYRLYRFLTDLEDILQQETDDYVRLQKLCPLVRHLLNSSEWLQAYFLLPDPSTGWSVQMLYDEPDFPITIQMVAWAPETTSPVHNHGTWGIVALLDGQENNSFWRRSPTTQLPDQIEATGNRTLAAGDILCFMPNAIHQIEAIGCEPSISFNIYGETSYDQRFEFDPIQATAKIF